MLHYFSQSNEPIQSMPKESGMFDNVVHFGLWRSATAKLLNLFANQGNTDADLGYFDDMKQLSQSHYRKALASKRKQAVSDLVTPMMSVLLNANERDAVAGLIINKLLPNTLLDATLINQRSIGIEKRLFATLDHLSIDAVRKCACGRERTSSRKLENACGAFVGYESLRSEAQSGAHFHYLHSAHKQHLVIQGESIRRSEKLFTSDVMLAHLAAFEGRFNHAMPMQLPSMITCNSVTDVATLQLLNGLLAGEQQRVLQFDPSDVNTSDNIALLQLLNSRHGKPIAKLIYDFNQVNGSEYHISAVRIKRATRIDPEDGATVIEEQIDFKLMQY